ncbi:cytochrome P450 [Chaetomium sp. MPI-CAGE-AT-0009]|nr:cytochrome P450 [Chaetomium sp. MPI-CAGE-AT-0009]
MLSSLHSLVAPDLLVRGHSFVFRVNMASRGGFSLFSNIDTSIFYRWTNGKASATQFIGTLGPVIVVVLALLLRNVGRRPERLPPGPPTLPIVGNLHLMPKSHAWLQYTKWARQYGPIFSLILGTKIFIVITSDQVVKDLLEKRSRIYSSRPESYLAYNVLSNGLRMSGMKYGDTWRMSRRLMHNMLHMDAAKAYTPYQDLECKQMLADLLDRPEQYADHLKRFTNSLTTQMVYGFRIVDIHDPRLVQFYSGFAKFAKVVASQTSALLDLYPILRWLPECLLPTLREARRVGQAERDFYVGLWLSAKQRIENGMSNPCFCIGVAKAQEKEGWSDDLAGYTSGSALEAGSDTTSATLIGFIQAMILYPEAQKLVRDEIDRVCGERMPQAEDEPNLPMVVSYCPFAVPHSNTEDDEYLGYKIPKGSTVLLNTWGIHFDPSRYPDPGTFNPLRYANDNSTSYESAANPDITKRDHFGFGATRRVCQGFHVADRSLFFAISRLLWAFDIRKAVDEHGNEITPDREDMMDSLVTMPNPFPARITPRSESRAAQVRDIWADCQKTLDHDKQWKETPEGISFGRWAPL